MVSMPCLSSNLVQVMTQIAKGSNGISNKMYLGKRQENFPEYLGLRRGLGPMNSMDVG